MAAMTQNVEDIHMDVIARPRTDKVVFVEPTVKRVRAMLGGETVVDSRRTLILFEKGHLPVYYFPLEDVREDLLEESEKHTHCPRKGEASYWTIRAGGKVAENAVWRYPEPIEDCPDIAGHVAFYWNAMDSWWEEDDQVFKHARDPYHRVDVLRSSRHVTVELDGTVVAETQRPLLLIETGLPPRWYIPRADVRFALLTPTDSESTCPYKGVASYFTANVDGTEYEDIAWTYVAPWPECPKIEQAVCFFSERDAVTLTIDGEEQERPETHWKHGVQDR
jgi:uncharacterized protein (DUF427 family)